MFIEKLFNVKDKTYIIAGGAGQIGFSICQSLLLSNANVIVADFDIENFKSKYGEPSNKKTNLKLKNLDVSEERSIKGFFWGIRKRYIEVHGLVNCFHFKGNTRKLDSNSSFFTDFENYSVSDWDQIHDVNLRGTFLMCQNMVKMFKQNRFGSIVNISSTYGNVSPNPSIYGDSGINSPVAYASSKSAIINLTRYIATHYAKV